jgi:prepilin-type N-terminal cleavage/methylation domain-containing protein
MSAIFTKRGRKGFRLTYDKGGFSLIELMIVLVIMGILAGLAIPRYMSSATKAKQTEAKELLRQIYFLQRSYFHANDHYWVPPDGAVGDRDHPDAFIDLGMEIMPTARYKYTITGDRNHFTATATAESLDDDPAIDQWKIDESGTLQPIVDDSKVK